MQRLADQIEPSALIAEYISPAAGPRSFPLAIPSERNGSGSRDGHYSRLARCRAYQSHERIVRHDVVLRLDQLTNVSFFIRGAAAESQARRFELCAFETRFAEAAANRAKKSLPTFRFSDVIAWTSAADSDHASRFIADQRGRARLSAVDAQE